MELVPGSDSDDVMPTNPGVKLTYDDFVLFPDDGRRHELIDGEHYVTPSPNRKHQKVSGQLHLLIGTWLEQHPIGQIYYAPFDVVFTRFDVVEPDLLYMSNERAALVLTAANVQGTPELVVEIGSPGTGSGTRRSSAASTRGPASPNTGSLTRISMQSACTNATATASAAQWNSTQKPATC